MKHITPSDAAKIVFKLLAEPVEAEVLLEEAETLAQQTKEDGEALEHKDVFNSIRRAYIRSLSSAIEGVVWLMKQVCLAGAEPFSVSLSMAEQSLLAEKTYEISDKGEAQEKGRFLQIYANLRFAVNMVNKVFKVSIDLQTDTEHWQNFRKFIDIRNRITHPRNVLEADVTPDEIVMSKGVFDNWFSNIYKQFIEVLINSTTLSGAKIETFGNVQIL